MNKNSESVRTFNYGTQIGENLSEWVPGLLDKLKQICLRNDNDDFLKDLCDGIERGLEDKLRSVKKERLTEIKTVNKSKAKGNGKSESRER